MKFSDVELQQHYERVVSLMTSLPDELRPVCALLDAYSWFTLTEGDDTPRVREIMQRLTDPELRPGLRRWYRERRGAMNPAASEFRQTLSQLVGESL